MCLLCLFCPDTRFKLGREERKGGDCKNYEHQ